MGWSFESIGREFQQSVKKILRDYAEALVLALALALVLRAFVVSTYRVTTDSMQPLLNKGDFLLGYKIPYGAKMPFGLAKRGEVRVHRGDLAVFDCKGATFERICVSQVVGLPGDKVEVQQGILFLNDQRIGPYDAGASLNVVPLIVPPRSVYVLSRNPKADQDSRTFGPISYGALEAKVLWIWFSYWDGPKWDRIGPPVH